MIGLCMRLILQRIFTRMFDDMLLEAPLSESSLDKLQKWRDLLGASTYTDLPRDSKRLLRKQLMRKIVDVRVETVRCRRQRTMKTQKVVVLRELRRAIIYTTWMIKQVTHSHVRMQFIVYRMN